MPISYERANELSHGMIERLVKTPGITLRAEKEVVRNRIQKLILEWDREVQKLDAEARKRLLQKNRRVVEGSREWDLLLGQELEALFTELLAKGE